jgi:hypothetical protein
MKFHVFFLALLITVPAFAALPPFLFTPNAKEIKQFGSGYSITLDNGQTLSVDRFGMDYRITAGQREVAVFKQTKDGWVESPGGRTWILGKDGKWRTSSGDLMLARVITDIVLHHSGGKIIWQQKGETWIRK